MAAASRNGTSHGSTEITVTDFGSSFTVNLPPSTLADTGLGTTSFGASNVFTLSTLAAVNVSPEADLGTAPLKLASTSTARFGSTLVTAIHSFPSASFAAMASTRGSVTSPWVYLPGSNETGTKAASWNGTYIL